MDRGDSPFLYRPSIGLNGFSLGIFLVFLIIHAVQGVRYKTWTFLVAMGLGNLGEIIGYAGRIMAWNNPWNGNAFLIQIVCLTIAPAFFAAGIYLCLSRIVTIYGANISRIKPINYTRLFIGCDIISLVLQATGGGMASAAEDGDHEATKLGTDIMLVGVAFQVATLTLFMTLCSEFAWRVLRRTGELDSKYIDVRESRRFKIFLYVLGASTILIQIRSVFRLIEMAQGFEGDLAGDEAAFFILEGIMVILAVGLFNVWHPGMAMREAYHSAKLDRRSAALELKSSSASTV